MVYRTPPPEPPPRNRQELYERIAAGGKDEIIYEEMIRLGFWSGDKPRPFDPPDETRRMTELRERLATLRKNAGTLQNLAALEIERKKREETKQRRLGERAAAKAETKEAKTRELTYLGARVSAGLGPGRRTSDA